MTNSNMSPEAQSMQAQMVGNPSLLQHYQNEFKAGRLAPMQAAAFQELLTASKQQSGASPTNAPTPSSSSFTGSPAAFPNNGLIGGPTRQTSSQGQLMPQWPNMPQQAMPQQQPAAPLDPQVTAEVSKLMAEMKSARETATSLESYQRRVDITTEQRQIAANQLPGAKAKVNAVGQKLSALMHSNPTAQRLIQQHLLALNSGAQAQNTASAAVGSTSTAEANNAFQLQQQQLMRARNGAMAGRPGGVAPAAGSSVVGGRSNTPSQAGASPAPSSIVSSNHNLGPLPPIANDLPQHLTQSRPEHFAAAGRPTLNQGLAAQPMMSSPAVVRPAPSHTATGLSGVTHAGDNGIGSLGAGGSQQPDPFEKRAINKRKLADLVASVDPAEKLDPEVEELLLEVADEFIESVAKAACRLAQHRKADRLEVKDVQLHLEHVWDMRIPGYASDEVRVSQNRRLNVPPSHSARLSAARDIARRRA